MCKYRCQKKQSAKWSRAQERSTGSRYLFVSHQHRVGHKRRWYHPGRICRIRSRAGLAQNIEQFQGMVLGREACKGDGAEAEDRAKTLHSGSQGAGVFLKRRSGHECQTLGKSNGCDPRRMISVKLGDQRLDSKTANRDGSQPASCLYL